MLIATFNSDCNRYLNRNSFECRMDGTRMILYKLGSFASTSVTENSLNLIVGNDEVNSQRVQFLNFVWKDFLNDYK